jgi:predicted nucleotidyltransferase
MQSRSSSSVKIFYPTLSQAAVVSRLQAGMRELEKQLPLVYVVLFGSYAKGNYTAGSDIDLLVVYRGEARPDAYACVKKILDLPRLEPHVYAEADMRDSVRRSARWPKRGSCSWISATPASASNCS